MPVLHGASNVSKHVETPFARFGVCFGHGPVTGPQMNFLNTAAPVPVLGTGPQLHWTNTAVSGPGLAMRPRMNGPIANLNRAVWGPGSVLRPRAGYARWLGMRRSITKPRRPRSCSASARGFRWEVCPAEQRRQMTVRLPRQWP